MRIALRGPYNPYSGYGMDLLGLAIALSRDGHDVMPIPTNITAGIPQDVANLLVKVPSGRYDLGILHQPPFDLKPPKGMVMSCDRLIGWTMWEQTHLTREHMRGHKQGQRPWKDLTAIVCYDQVTREALDFYDARVPKPIVQGGVWTDEFAYVDRDWNGPFGFLMVGELHQRKDPFVAIEAYRELREEGRLENATLTLKTSVPGLHPGIEELIPGVKVHCGVWSREQIRDLYAQHHVLLAPSRGEGKNMPALEFQLTGGVTIATGWGGHTAWQHPSYSYAIDYTLVPIEVGKPPANARADKEHLKQLMAKTYENRQETREMGRIASGAIAAQCSWENVARKMIVAVNGVR